MGQRFSLKFHGLARTAVSNAETAHSMLRPAVAGGAWRDLHVGVDAGGTTKLFINKDQSPQQLRLSLVARVARDALKLAHPGLVLSVGNPSYHPQKKMAAFVSHSGVDVLEITAESRHVDPSLKFDPAFVKKFEVKHDAIIADVRSRLASRSRTPDTSSWV